MFRKFSVLALFLLAACAPPPAAPNPVEGAFALQGGTPRARLP
jgi:hypothetical protein